MKQTPESAKGNSSLRSQTARGVAWMMLLKLAIRSLSFISTLVLVRLLSPEDFGIVGMAMVFIAIMDTFSWLSFDVVLIQNQRAGRAEYDTAWTFNVLFKTLSAVVLLILAQPAARYYNEPGVAALIAVLAAAQFISGFENIGVVNFRKRMEFDREFRFMLLSKVSGFVVTLPLAFALRNYWALIAGQVVMKIAAVVLSFTMDSYRPRLSLAARHALFDFSKWLMLGNICGALRLRVTELLIGRYTGAKALGFFSVSLELSNTPTTELIAPINRAVFPAYAKISNDMDALRAGYLKVIAVIALIAIPAGLGIAATAPLIVPVALGEQWLPAIPLFVVLAFNGVLNALQTNIGSVFLAIGQPRVLALLQAASLVIVLASVSYATVNYGIHGAALAFLGSTLLLTPVTFTIFFRTINLHPFEFIRSLWRAVTGAVVMYLVTQQVVGLLLERNHGIATLTHLLIAVMCGALTYVAVVLLAWLMCRRPQGAESFVLESLLARVAARRAT